MDHFMSISPISATDEALVRIVGRIMNIHGAHVEGYNALVSVYEGLRKQMHTQREIKNNIEDLIEDAFAMHPGLGILRKKNVTSTPKQQYTRSDVLDLIIKHLDETDIPEFLRNTYHISGRRINDLGGIKQLRKEAQNLIKTQMSSSKPASVETSSVMEEEFTLEVDGITNR